MKRKFDYSWVIVVICFICVCTGLGFCSGGRTMYLTAITDALDIKRSVYSLTDGIRFLTSTVINVFLGTLVNKFGTKKLMCAGFVCLIGFAMLSSYAESVIMFYIAAVLLGIGLAWSGTAMMGIVVNTWCKKNQGAITGAILCANGLGGALSAQILSPIIFEEGNPFGYRNSYRLVALLLAVVLVMIIVFFRDRPKNAEKTVISAKKKHKARGAGWVGMDYKEAIRKPYFYLALICMTITGMSLQGIAGIATPHMYDMGMDKGFVATLITLSSLSLMGSKFIVGFLCDRKGVKLVTNLCIICSFCSLSLLFLVGNSAIGKGIAIARIPFYAIAMPLETVMLPILAQELFGNRSFAKIVGLFSAASSTGFAIGAPFANLCYDIFGNYNIALFVFFCLLFFVLVSIQIVFKKAGRDRKLIESLETTEE